MSLIPGRKQPIQVVRIKEKSPESKYKKPRKKPAKSRKNPAKKPCNSSVKTPAEIPSDPSYKDIPFFRPQS